MCFRSSFCSITWNPEGRTSFHASGHKLTSDILLWDFLVESRTHCSINLQIRGSSKSSILKHQSSPRPSRCSHVRLLVRFHFYETCRLPKLTPTNTNTSLMDGTELHFCIRLLWFSPRLFSSFSLWNLWMPFCPSLFLPVESWTLSWGKWGLRFFSCSSGSFIASWTCQRHRLGVIW